MACRIKISTLGVPLNRVTEMNHPEALDHMMGFWRETLAVALAEDPDLIVLPEWCDHYSGMPLEERADYYDLRGDSVRDMLAEAARDNRCYIAYPAARRGNDGAWRNSIQIIDRAGEVVGVYDKNYLTSEESEAGHRGGDGIAVVDCDLGRVGFALCFDLNFMELAQAYAAADVDLIIFSSLWHGGLAQQCWAHTCQAYFVGAISGADNPDSVINPLGEIIASGSLSAPCMTVSINTDFHIVPFWVNNEKLKAMKEKYGAGVTVQTLSRTGRMMVTSEMDDVSTADMVGEYGIVSCKQLHDAARAERENL
jgi:predicted amidohydrolase